MNSIIKLQQKAETEVREYSDAPIIYIESEVPKNHLYCVRGEYCDFYETSKYVMVYLKPKVWGLNNEGNEVKEGDSQLSKKV